MRTIEQWTRKSLVMLLAVIRVKRYLFECLAFIVARSILRKGLGSSRLIKKCASSSILKSSISERKTVKFEIKSDYFQFLLIDEMIVLAVCVTH